ncbi:hypothetical protein ACH4MM_03495 [Streptomyces pratensis]|uniref:hypothetical protein n=1 Tax=Streptomyces pratensis TaxID=1169025 RepID=UPI00379A374D
MQAQRGRLDLIANLIPVRSGSTTRPALRAAPMASAQLASVLTQLADEQVGPLATVRGLVEHTAHRVTRPPGAASSDTAHRLELIARRLHSIQQDLDTTAAHLLQPRVANVPPAIRHTAHRSP